MCSNVAEQLTAHFLHVLILRLAFVCEHPDDLTEISCSAQKLFSETQHTLAKCIVPHFPLVYNLSPIPEVYKSESEMSQLYSMKEIAKVVTEGKNMQKMQKERVQLAFATIVVF